VNYAVFFRNLNLGRRNCPTKAQFEQAFVAAGAATASSFLTDGTIVFAAATESAAKEVLVCACEILLETCGLNEASYIRTMEYLAKVVSLNPFGTIERTGVHECCVSFLQLETSPLSHLPRESRGRDVKVLRITDSEVLSLSLCVGRKPGSPNAFLEKVLGVPATTRSWDTVVRLVQRYA
jgi:uncharacterized protein (DUF1697 family)